MHLIKIIVLFSLSLLLGIGSVRAAETWDAANLKPYQWKNRLLLVFSLNSEEPAYQALWRELQEQASGVRERDLLVFHVLEQGKSFMNSREFSPAAAQALRQRFRIAPGAFIVVLVGKDGGVKLKRAGRVPLGDIFKLIDGMPMRQQEMQKQ